MRRIAHTPTQSTSSYYERVTADSARSLEASQKSHQVEQMHEKKDRLAGWFDKHSAVVHKHVISTFAKEQSRKRKAMNTPEYFKSAAKCAKLAPLVAVAAPEAVSAHRVTAPGKVSAPRVTAYAKLAKRPIQERIILKVNKGKNSDWTSRRVVNPGKRGS
ncbi:hypothetical protein MAR_023377 [Mya arenaria]|uniref:Uncharacterized protein n=1 Tax=Mya arenaria TaxID=6604 RepID=A0ABY7DR08_MYAAR|nr:hypothetical protein MAR_023377 [Mya arenaria]